MSTVFGLRLRRVAISFSWNTSHQQRKYLVFAPAQHIQRILLFQEIALLLSNPPGKQVPDLNLRGEVDLALGNFPQCFRQLLPWAGL